MKRYQKNRKKITIRVLAVSINPDLFKVPLEYFNIKIFNYTGQTDIDLYKKQYGIPRIEHSEEKTKAKFRVGKNTLIIYYAYGRDWEYNYDPTKKQYDTLE